MRSTTTTTPHRPLRQPGCLDAFCRDPWLCVLESLRVCFYRRVSILHSLASCSLGAGDHYLASCLSRFDVPSRPALVY